MKRVLFFIMFLLIVGLVYSVSAIAGNKSKQQWPEIIAVEKTIVFVDHKKMSNELKILGLDGTPLYLLECYLNAYDHEDPDFAYSGDFECRLTSLYSKEVHSTLLTEEVHQTRDWQSRGRFFVEEIIGKCADYPDYGRVRRFNLRGMSLTLTIKNIKMKQGSIVENVPWNRDRIDELELSIKIAHNPNARSASAEPTKYMEPPKTIQIDKTYVNCEKILQRQKK